MFRAPDFARTVLFCVALVCTATVSQAAPIAKTSGAAMCAAVTKADFVGVGISNASDKPTANISDNGASAYCVYAGRSGATGGLEVDVFYPAGGTTPEDAKATMETAMGESGGAAAYQKLALPGVDDARISTNLVSGGPPFADIMVRKGELVFSISIPTGKQAHDQLVKLATIALRRF